MTESLMVKLAEAKANELAEDVRREIISAAKNAKRWLEESQKTREEIAAEIKNEHDEENQYLKNELRYSVARLNSVELNRAIVLSLLTLPIPIFWCL